MHRATTLALPYGRASDTASFDGGDVEIGIRADRKVMRRILAEMAVNTICSHQDFVHERAAL
jgi:hypothetical protein